MYDLDRMKKALEGPSIRVPFGVPREMRRKWVSAMAHLATGRKLPNGCVTIEELMDQLEEEFPGFKKEAEAARQAMVEDGSLEELKKAWMNPDNHKDITHLILPQDECLMQKYLQEAKDPLQPVGLSCPCSRCTPRM